MVSYYDRIQGEYYYDTLQRLHDILEPETYFEIGSRNGESVAISRCSTIAVDPGFAIGTNVIGAKPSCHFYQMTSDRFFRKHSPMAIFGMPIDLAFLDGLHCAEFLLRDFYNTERYCRRNSIIALHDCLPAEIEITARSPTDPIQQQAERAGFWAGDVWKVLPILRKYRPDLKIVVLDAQPTGLLLVTNLDPANKILEDSYVEIVRDIVVKYRESEFHEFWASLDILPTRRFVQPEDIWQHVWL